MRILFIGDIVAEPGVDLVLDLLPRIKNRWKPDFIIANGENAHMGKGITTPMAKKFRNAGIGCITTGNHVWDTKKKDVLIDLAGYVLRPMNYPAGNYGVGANIFEVGNEKIGVINAQGLAFMYNIDNPLVAVEEEVAKMRKTTPTIFLDFHAEATAEKQIMGWALAGKVTAVVGTHTHIQTADEKILPGGTGYITDSGMTGPYDSVIGLEKEIAIERFRLQTPVYYKHAKGDPRMCGVLLESDQDGRCTKIARVNINKSEFNAMDEKGKTPFDQ